MSQNQVRRRVFLHPMTWLTLRQTAMSLTVVMLFVLGASMVQGQRAVSPATQAADREQEGEIAVAHLTLLEFTLGQHTIQEVEAKLGKPTQYVNEDSHGKAVCYVAARKGDQTIVAFGTGIMGGETYLLNFQLMAEEVRFKERRKCQRSPWVSREVTTASGLKLGMDRGQIITLLGTPTREEKDRLNFSYGTHKQKMLEGRADCIYVGTWIEATFSRSKLIALLAVKIEESDVPEACQPKDMLQKKEG
jgi:hypothetical protein